LEELLECMLIHRVKYTEVYAGEIAAAVGLKNTTTGDTL
jgi:translation elongation factor EF-G